MAGQMQDKNVGSMSIDLNILSTLRRWLWLLVAAAIIAGTAGFLMSTRQAPMYESSTRVIVGPSIDSPNPSLNELRTAGQLMQTYAKLAATRPLLDTLITELDLTISPEVLMENVNIVADQETQILTVIVRDTDPNRAAEIANGIADRLVRLSSDRTRANAQLNIQLRNEAEQMQKVINDTEARITQLEAELRAAGESSSQADPVTQRLIETTEARLNQLETELENTEDLEARRLLLIQIVDERNRLLDIQERGSQREQQIIDEISRERDRLSDAHRTLASLYDSIQSNVTNQIQVVEPALPGQPVLPLMPILTLLSSIGGLAVATLFILAFEFFNTSIRSEDEISHATGIPVLNSIAKYEGSRETDQAEVVIKNAPLSCTAEDYRLLGANLLSAKSVSSLLVTSPQTRGKATGELAVNLAVVLTQAGRDVILVDADWRNPVITKLFRLTDEPGLTDILSDPFLNKTVEFTEINWIPKLTILPIGTASSDALPLFTSSAMVDLIEELDAESDAVIISAPSILSFADSRVMASHVQSVLLVAYRNATERDELRDTVVQLRALGAHIVGAVLSDDGPTGGSRILPKGFRIPKWGTAGTEEGKPGAQVDLEHDPRASAPTIKS